MAARRQASARYREKFVPWVQQLAPRLTRAPEILRKKGRRPGNVWQGTLITSLIVNGSPAWSTYLLCIILLIAAYTHLRAYGTKHGPRAWLERRQQLEARRAEAQERADFARYEAEYQERMKRQDGEGKAM
ncbi:hypothetical protein C8F04DRAFT_1176920 [Mycena alexandri]|uniref:Uncharacterized protein n=1 Tax=Mycena alexandri TaxID=1745969 RepID=A0AAD6T9G0_9AGAR|nr:hypothetical protein C8F04DRAFT_1176920 [Mycena alexandri]